MVSYQWSIFWANLSPVEGSEQKGERPVVVVSAEEVNHAIPITCIVPLTSMKNGRNIYPTEVFLEKKETGLDKNSIAMAHQIRVISKARFKSKCGYIKSFKIKQKIKLAIKKFLDLD